MKRPFLGLGMHLPWKIFVVVMGNVHIQIIINDVIAFIDISVFGVEWR